MITVGSNVVVYGGATPGCGQLTWILTTSTTTKVWCWTQVLDSPLEPKQVARQPVAIVGANIYVNGYSTYQNQAQLWKMNLYTMRWWQIPRGQAPSLNGGVALGLPDIAVVVFCSPVTDSSQQLGQVQTWLYSINSSSWINISTPEEIGDRRHYSLVAANSDTVLLFGGKDDSSNNKTGFNDVWKLWLQPSRLNDSEWSQVSITGNSPKPRFAHSALSWDSGMIIFGGQSQNTCLNDMWHFTITNNTWQRWHSVEPNTGPQPNLESNCFSSSTRVGQQILVISSCDTGKKNDSKLYPCTWLYLPHLRMWKLVYRVMTKSSTSHTFTFTYERYLFVANTVSSFRLQYMLLQCPEGLFSKDLHKEPCRLCEKGKYSSFSIGKNTTTCQPCTPGLTTSQPGTTSLTECNICINTVCQHGSCYVENHNMTPTPRCHCHIGFSGVHCTFPTYYLVALGVITFILVISLMGWILVRVVKRKRLRETELTRQVQELISVWQIKYEELTLEGRIGAGGSGQVYRAQYREITVAVKMLHFPNDYQLEKEFEREIRFMQTIRHPNIVMFIGAGKNNTQYQQSFLVVEYMPRGSLRDVLDDQTIALTPLQRIEFALDAGTGMAFLHSLTPPRIHNDLKSDNLLVSNKWVVKISDFGLGLQIQPTVISRRRSSSITTPLMAEAFQMTGVTMGATRWRAPELSVQHTYATSTDVYR